MRVFVKINDFYENKDRVEVILLSRNTADTGLRIFNSIESHELDISRAVFCGGESPYKYVKAFGVDLFLSSSKDDVKMAIQNSVASARIISSKSKKLSKGDTLLRIAFDGDAVLFSDESEKVYQSQGLDAFQGHEQKHAEKPLSAGPFKSFLAGLHKLQSVSRNIEVGIRTALVTARSAPAHERAIRTLMEWNIEVDEAMFLGGLDKSPFLKEFEPDFFFDDQTGHCNSAARVTPTGQVLSGITNKAS